MNYCKTRILYASLAALLIGVVTVPVRAADMPVKTAGESAPQGPQPMAIGGWLFSPTLFAGAVYNSNVNQTEAGKISSWGERVVPGFTANVDNGIYQTNIYGIADLQNYSASGVNHQTTVDAKAGITQLYMPLPDLTVRGNFDFTRQADVFGSSAFTNANTTLSPTSAAPVAPVTVSPQVNPDRYNQYSGAVGVDKRFGRAFAGLSGSVIATKFDSDPGFATSRDGTVYTVASRFGFDLTPQIYAYVDPQVDWQRYTDSARNSNGYRVTGGIGTSAPGLWQGEVYGGYQAEKNDIVGTYDSGVFGIRVGYSPTRMWDLKASLDETLGASSIATGGATGLATRVTTALLTVGYNGLPRGWGANGRFGYVRTSFVNVSRTDNGWLAGANVTYEVWRNLGLTLDYQYKSVDSDVVGQSFDQHLVSLGASYKY
ncbi:MAG TPA: outer membrane beta-barrel protein [Pseudolabrys sp.]|uniref:outer membrane beta-barrel protein n=1 Tax=Pseudolabrys sp. TaxID=1960880 RepID=UPI002DDCE501|nr:outer membrane beta-barrel protein [Pseudolabrys sp.]HEV2630175.1 outer membrane beta-barrel protein [Pseudolabrys sp.]